MKKNKKAFTLMELLVVIVIIGIVSIFTYTPYIYYKNKASVNVSSKTLSQSIYLARQLAINGVSTASGTTNKNMNIGLLMEAGKNGKIGLYGYTGSSFNPNTSTGKLLKKISLEPNIWIKGVVEDSTPPRTYSGAIFYFSAIKGVPSIYLEKSDGSFTPKSSNSNFEINLGFKGTDQEILTKTIKYNTKTYVIDY